MIAPRIVVVGSYAAGLTLKVTRLPSPGETVLATGYRVDYGGKGSNQAVGCARLGVEVRFVARIGHDNFGEMALQLFRQEGIDITFVRETPKYYTGVGFILVEAGTGNNSIAIDPGANESLSTVDVAEGAAAFKDAKVVLTQLEIPVEAAEAALARGRAQGAITILNPAPVRTLPDAVLRLVDVITPNQSEAKVLTGRSPTAEDSPEQVARDLLRAGVKNVVITLGESGALMVTPSSTKRVPAIAVNAVDSTGAGDAFNAGLATALASGESLESAVESALIAGGLAVTKEGVIPSLPDREEFVRFCETRGIAAPGWLRSLANMKRV